MQVLSTGQVARRLQVSSDTILLLIKNGELRAERLPGKKSHWRIRQDALQEYVSRNGLTLLPEDLTDSE